LPRKGRANISNFLAHGDKDARNAASDLLMVVLRGARFVVAVVFLPYKVRRLEDSTPNNLTNSKNTAEG
jgi:hypothetical protein